jgi:hypothetical protein
MGIEPPHPQPAIAQEAVAAWGKGSQTKASPGVLYRGVVINNVDPEGLGRVKVLIEAISQRESKNKDDGMWAWTLNVFGGGQESGTRYGATFPYPIGCKVFILFLHSSTLYDNPVVIGGWYQQDRIPLEVYDRTKPQDKIPKAWGFRTPKGHSFYLREEDDAEGIYLESKGGRKIVISDKKDEERIVMTGKQGGTIELLEGKDGGKINLLTQGGNSIQLDDAKGSCVITTAESVNIATKKFTVTASENASVVSTGNTTVIAQKAAAIYGGISTAVGIKDPIAGAPPMLLLEGFNTFLTVPGTLTETIGLAQTTTITGMLTLTVSGLTTITTSDISLTTGAITAEAPTAEITSTITVIGTLSVI